MATLNNPEEFKKRKLKDVLKVMDSGTSEDNSQLASEKNPSLASEGASLMPLPTPRPKAPPSTEDTEIQQMVENTPQALASGGLATKPIPPIPGVPGSAPQAPKQQKRLVRRAMKA
jgi:hypothetical protein